jgi:hypothetical protein
MTDDIWRRIAETTAPYKDEAEIAKSEARTDTKIAPLEGKLDTLSATLVGKIDALANDLAWSRRTIIMTIIGSTAALAGLLVAVMVYGDSIFSRGMSVRDVVQSVTKDCAL